MLKSRFFKSSADPIYVNITGDSMTGPLGVPSPSELYHAANKGYVDTEISGSAQTTLAAAKDYADTKVADTSTTTLNASKSYTDSQILSTSNSLQNNIESKISKSLFIAKGDLISALASGQPVKVAIGTDGQVLVADSTQISGLKWATVSVASSAPVPIYASAYTTSGLSVAAGTAVTLTGLTIVSNYNNALTTSGVFTVPAGQGGLYFAGGIISYAQSTWSGVGNMEASLFINQSGSTNKFVRASSFMLTANTTAIISSGGGGVLLNCQPGDSILFRAFQYSGGTKSLITTDSSYNNIFVFKVN